DGVNNFMFCDADIIDDPQHVFSSSQVFGESVRLMFVCKIHLDKVARERMRRTAGNPYDRPTLLSQGICSGTPDALGGASNENRFGHHRDSKCKNCVSISI